MDQRSELLEQLRIDRGNGPRWAVPWLWSLVAAVTAVGIAALLWRLPPDVTDGVSVGVATAQPVPTVERSALDASGYVVARRQATVSSKVTGRIVELLIDEGQRVLENQVIARLDASNAQARVVQAQALLDQQKANLEAAQVAFDNAGPIFERHQEQLLQEFISAQTFDIAKASYDAARTTLNVATRAVSVAVANLAVAERELDDTVVRAPFAGIVTVKAAQEGEIVSPISSGGGFTRTGIGTIVDMESLEVQVDVSESFINRVEPGQKVVVKLNAYPDWEVPAHVIAIVPTADRAKATVRVRIELEWKDPRILPQMGVKVSFLSARDEERTRHSEGAVIVPRDSVQAQGDSGVVFVLRGDHVEQRTVRLGSQIAEGQIVLAGLASGARVASGDLSRLADGARVKPNGER